MKRTLSEILADFEKPIQPQYIKQKPTFSKGEGKGSVDFVPWQALCRLLNQHTAGYWEWKVRTQFMSDRTVIEGSLTIHGSDGSLTREATGNESNDCDRYGDPSSNAEAMALRRCCAKFGLGLGLWEKGKATNGSTLLKNNGLKQPVTASKTNKGENKGTLTREEWESKFGQQRAKFDGETQIELS